jgi:hypothetical protein
MGLDTLSHQHLYYLCTVRTCVHSIYVLYVCAYTVFTYCTFVRTQNLCLRTVHFALLVWG